MSKKRIWVGGILRSLIVSGLRKENHEDWTRLVVDIEFNDVPEAAKFPERTLWVSVKKENEHMLADDVYDAFIPVALYIAMYYKADLHIKGCVSKTLYRNAKIYMQGILRDFSDDLSRVDVQVEGFKTADGKPDIIGTGFSCGVDSLSTVYDHYVQEEDTDYKINGLFMLNCGWHGNYYNPSSFNMFKARCELVQPAADELGLKMYIVDSNFHAFTYSVLNGANDKLGYIAIYSCVLALERAVKKYYVASTFSYKETMKYGYTKHNLNFDGFASPYAVQLASTEKINFIMDGCQNLRCEKIEDIADWHIAQKYLNVCLGDSHIFGRGEDESREEHAHNCSTCEKCVRTQLTLEALGKLNNFSEVFYAERYK